MTTGTWMTELHKQIKNKTLRQIVIPGTHNSGSFSQWMTSSVRNQNHDLATQLEGGIRYFDFEVLVNQDWFNQNKKADQRFQFCHGPGDTADELEVKKHLERVNDFAADNSREIVILDFDNFYFEIGSYDGMKAFDKRALEDLIKRIFGARITEPTSMRTIDDLVTSGENVILLGFNSSVGFEKAWNDVENPHKFVEKPFDFIGAGVEATLGFKQSELQREVTNKFDRTTLVEPDGFVAIGLDCWTTNIADAANDTNRKAYSWIPDWYRKFPQNINIVAMDFADLPQGKALVKLLIDIEYSFQKGIDAALPRSSSSKEYFFKGKYFISYTPNVGTDSGYPWLIADGWTRWPPNFEQGIDAALSRPSSNKEYFFKGNQYIRYTPNVGMDSGYPKPIAGAGNWTRWPPSFQEGIDAALSRPSDNKEYFFKGDQFISYTPNVGMDPGYPKPIAGNWTGF